MKSYATAEDILDEIAERGSARVSWDVLQNSFFRGDAQARMDEWCEFHQLEWTSDESRKGETITFRRRPGWEPRATEGRVSR